MVPKECGFNQSETASCLCTHEAWRFRCSPAMARDGELIQTQSFCHHSDTICHPNSSYVTTKLYETSASGCNNNTIFQNDLFSRFLPSTYVAWQRRSLGDTAKVARCQHQWINHFSCLKFRFCVTTVSNIIVKWCSGIACDWCASLDISSILALRVHCSTFFIYLVLCRVSVYCRVYDLGLRS